MTAHLTQPSIHAPSSEWLVYADALQEARDPRGELIVLNHAADEGKSIAERDAFVTGNAEALLGEAGSRIDAYRLRWRFCFVDSAEVVVRPNDDGSKLVADLLASPAAAHLRELAVVGVMGEQPVELTPAMVAVAQKLPTSCTTLRFIDDRASKTTLLASRDFEPEQNGVLLDTLEPFWKIPTLERLHVSVTDAHQIELGKIEAPSLRSFVFHNLRFADTIGDARGMIGKLASAAWPNLEELEIRLPETWVANVPDDTGAYVECYAGNDDWEDRMDEAEEGENEGVDWSDLRPLLEALKKSRLKRLALTSFDSWQSLLDTIAAAGLPPALEELDLSDSSIGDVEWFLGNEPLLAPLKRLVLERTSITDEDAKRLASLGPAIVHSNGTGARYRYLVGCE